MVHVETPVESCREWNAARPAGGAYCREIFEDLAGRRVQCHEREGPAVFAWGARQRWRVCSWA